jgi:HSP20 family protein
MVEQTQATGPNLAGWYPSILGPLNSIKERVAEIFSPRSDVGVTNDEYEISVELPGVSLEDITLEIHGSDLVVYGEKRTERTEEDKSFFITERSFGTFQRSFRLPSHVDTDKIDASFEDGVLKIRIPRAGDAPQTSRRIDIQNSSA